jgi:hypothetical protein
LPKQKTPGIIPGVLFEAGGGSAWESNPAVTIYAVKQSYHRLRSFMSREKEYLIDILEAAKLAPTSVSGKTKDEFLFLENLNVQ